MPQIQQEIINEMLAKETEKRTAILPGNFALQ